MFNADFLGINTLPGGRQLHPFLIKGSRGWKAEQVELAGETFTLFMQGLYGLRPPLGCVSLSFSSLFFGGKVSMPLMLQPCTCLWGLSQPLGERHESSNRHWYQRLPCPKWQQARTGKSHQWATSGVSCHFQGCSLAALGLWGPVQTQQDFIETFLGANHASQRVLRNQAAIAYGGEMSNLYGLN